MIRARFFVNKKECKNDYRPLRWPIQYPYWCTGENDSYFVLVAYIDSIEELNGLWPEASNIESEEVDKIFFSDRFPKPDWYKTNNNRTMRMIRKQAAKLEELEARRERLVNRVAKLDLKIEEQKEKISQYYRKQGINV